jgi:hypothetical protein
MLELNSKLKKAIALMVISIPVMSVFTGIALQETKDIMEIREERRKMDKLLKEHRRMTELQESILKSTERLEEIGMLAERVEGPLRALRDREHTLPTPRAGEVLVVDEKGVYAANEKSPHLRRGSDGLGGPEEDVSPEQAHRRSRSSRSIR